MERGNRKLLSNIIFSGIFQLLFLLGPIITTPYVARVFTPKSLGVYGTSYTLAMFFVQVATFGIPIFGSRRISRTKHENERSVEFFKIWFMQICTTILSFLVYIIITLIFIKNNQSIFLCQSLLILTCLFDISWFYIGIEEIKKNIFRNSISKLITIVLIFFIIKNENDLLIYTLINILGVFVGNLTMVLQVKNFISIEGFKRVHIKREDFIESLGLLIPQTVDSAKNAVSRVILAGISSYAEAGLYDQGLKIVTMLNGILQSMTTAIMPRITFLISDGKKDAAFKLVDKMTSTGSMIATIFICGVFSVSDFFVPLFFGSGYNQVIIIMKISSISLIYTVLSYIMGKGLLLSLSKDSEFRKATYISSFFLIFLNVVLVIPFGSLGAAVSFLIAAVIYFFSILYFLRSVISLKKIIVQMLYSIVVILIVVITISLFKMFILMNSLVFNFVIYGSASVFISLFLYYPFLKFDKIKHFFV